MTGRRVLGIIPARGGSKGVPRKNVRLLGGRPLLAYTIDAAKGSLLLSRYLVSTEDDEIADTAKLLGCEVVRRPAELAGDATPMMPVIRHATRAAEGTEDAPFDAVVLLQPTTPFRLSADIDGALAVLFDFCADCVIGVCRVFDYHPARMYRVHDGRLRPYDSAESTLMRQELSPVYHRNGAVYVLRRGLVDMLGSVLEAPHTRGFEMPPERSINIDDELDMLLAEALLVRSKQPQCSREARK